ncbi:MAG: hypothetical protein NWE88_10595 [Candidatus Bathyarchaeota archaeon]|nr:hypothetical protein [Candidatus Bathyarchaeota archaeon]
MSKINWKDTRLIYIMVFGIIYISSLAPIALPVPIVQWSKDFYATINEGVTVDFVDPPREFGGVEEGTRVFILNSGETSKLWGDMSEAVITVWKDLRARGANILLWSSSPDNEATLNKYLLPLMYGANVQNHPDYGVKFVNLGYVAGGNQLLEQWKDDLIAITPYDAYGNSLADMPMISNFNEMKVDADLMIGLDARGLETIYVVRYNTPVLEMGGTDSASYLALSYTAGYFQGMIMGQRGGAEYELLSGIPGKAMSYLQNAFTISTVMVILMIVTNVQYVLKKKEEN